MRILIVDDQEEIIRGIRSGVEWDVIPQIEEIFQAQNVPDAKAVFQKEKIDLLITDIEMPGENGLELVSWVNATYPDVKCILLTAHAKFTYAQDAVRLQYVDYILQPVQYSVLQDAIEKAILLIEKEKESKADMDLGSYWNAHRLELEQKIWLDYLSKHAVSEIDFLSHMESQGISLSPEETFAALIIYVLPGQVRLEEWNDPASVQTVMDKLQLYIDSFASHSCLLQKNGNHCSFVFATDNQADLLYEKIQAFFNLCSNSYDILLSIYFCSSPGLHSFPESFSRIEDQFQRTLVPKPGVYHLGDEQQEQIGDLPFTQTWRDCFVNKTTQFIWDSIQSCIHRNLKKGTMNRRTLSALQQAFLFSFQQSLQERSLSFSEIMTEQELIDGFTLSLHSVSDFEKFVNMILEKNRTLLDNLLEDDGDAIALARSYIAEHLAVSDLSRYDIAKAAHISESYLSHLFSKEMGLSIKDYINEERIKLAKSLLSDTSVPITLVAMKSGYNSASYFGTNFKKSTGITPADYRKQHQKPIKRE